MVEGGSTITQQLAKTSFTGADRTAFRKVQEASSPCGWRPWLSKEEILSRYLSNVYFGDNVYGCAPRPNTISASSRAADAEQSAMLAGRGERASRLAPTGIWKMRESGRRW
jgi:penicillin-binding protein 1A